MSSGSMRLEPQQKKVQRYELELANSVNPDAQMHWDEKISAGIVPTEVKLQGPVNTVRHVVEMYRLAQFEISVFGKLLEGEWKPIPSTLGTEIHYFGIGTGEALASIVPLANKANYGVVAYDAAVVGCDNGRKVLQDNKSEVQNAVLVADIEFACQAPYITKRRASKLVASRVLHVLDKEDSDWQRKALRNRKMARTAKRIGRLLPFLEVLLIHPEPKNNPDAKWGDTTPHSLEEVALYMREGLRLKEGPRSEVELQRLGTHKFHSHIYTAALIRRA